MFGSARQLNSFQSLLNKAKKVILQEKNQFKIKFITFFFNFSTFAKN